MKKIISTIIAMSAVISLAAGNSMLSDDESIESRTDKVLERGDLKKDKFKEVTELIVELDSIRIAYSTNIEELCTDTTRQRATIRQLQHFADLCTADTSIFSLSINPDAENVPQCLKKHLKVIQEISSMQTAIEGTECYIADYKKHNDITDKVDDNHAKKISGIISNDLIEINNIKIRIQNMDRSSLSQQQEDYFNKLKERFNTLAIYFNL